MTLPSNGLTEKLHPPSSHLGQDRAMFVSIRDCAKYPPDNDTFDKALQRLSLIAFMAQAAINRLDGRPGDI